MNTQPKLPPYTIPDEDADLWNAGRILWDEEAIIQRVQTARRAVAKLLIALKNLEAEARGMLGRDVPLVCPECGGPKASRSNLLSTCGKCTASRPWKGLTKEQRREKSRADYGNGKGNRGGWS